MEKFDKQKYDNEYAKNNYDRCIFNVPKGKKTVIETHWKAKGYKSLNTYVNDLIDADMGVGEKQTPSQTISIQGQKNVVMGNNSGNINIQ